MDEFLLMIPALTFIMTSVTEFVRVHGKNGTQMQDLPVRDSVFIYSGN